MNAVPAARWRASFRNSCCRDDCLSLAYSLAYGVIDESLAPQYKS